MPMSKPNVPKRACCRKVSQPRTTTYAVTSTNSPSQDPSGLRRRRAEGSERDAVDSAFVSVVSKILRAGEGKKVRALQDIVPEINAMEPEIERLSDDALRHKTVEFREELARRVAAGEAESDVLNDFLVEAYAVVREASKRVIGQRHFDVQLMGGAALHFGWIAEMKTGEGKTLVSTLPVYLNGLTGRGVHLVTVNDYLAKFHAEWMGRIHNWLGLSVGIVIPDVRHDVVAKQKAYACDVTYGTNQEFGF